MVTACPIIELTGLLISRNAVGKYVKNKFMIKYPKDDRFLLTRAWVPGNRA